MRNALPKKIIFLEMTQAVHSAVTGDVYEDVYWDVYEGISGDVDWVLERTVDEAVGEDPTHPMSQDFLREGLKPYA